RRHRRGRVSIAPQSQPRGRPASRGASTSITGRSLTRSSWGELGNMAAKHFRWAALAAAAAGALSIAHPAVAQVTIASGIDAGELDVPINKSQVVRADRAYSKALIGNPEIADIVPISPTSVYVLGKKTGTTSLTLYDRANRLIAVVDVVVGPDVTTLKRALSDLIPADEISARMSNDSVILEGVVRNSVEADRAVQIAQTYAPGKVVNLLSLGSAQQVMLEARFAEVKRSALSQIGVSWDVMGNNGKLNGISGAGSSLVGDANGNGVLTHGAIVGSFGIISRAFRAFGANFNVILDALERNGSVTTLADPPLG